MCGTVFPGSVRSGEIMSKETIHEAFNTDLNEAQTAEDAFAMLWIRYTALNEMTQPSSHSDGRMLNIQRMTPKVGHAITVYHAYARSKINGLLDQIEKIEQRRAVWQMVKEWFRRLV